MTRHYFTAAATAIAAAFLCVTLYPEHHGLPSGGSVGLWILSALIVALLVYIVQQAITHKPSEHTDAREESEPAGTSRQKKMFLLWSAFTLFLCIPLIRYPVTRMQTDETAFSMRDGVSLVFAAGLILFTLIHIATVLHTKRK